METDDSRPSDLNLSLDSYATPKSSSLGPPSIAGRDIYAIGSRGRGGKSGQTPKVRKTAMAVETVSQVNNCSTSNVKAKAVGTKSKSREGVKQSTGRKEQTDSESDMELSNKEIETEVRSSRRSTRKRKVLSSSESDLSSEASEDEEMAVLASKLNQRSKSGGGAMMDENVLEDYFSAHSGKTGIATSDHTLSKLARPKMDQQSMEEALRGTPGRFLQDRQLLYEEYKQLYPYWLFQISNGFSILLYGVGSKQKLLEDFRRECLSESCHLVINGFFPGLTIKQVLTKLSSEVFGHAGTFKSPVDQAQFITRELKTNVQSKSKAAGSGKARQTSGASSSLPSEIFLVIHNIDGQMLRGDTAQTALSILAQSPSIHVIASVDHINAPLLWDHKKLSRFNWLWHDTTTYEPYLDETSYENSLLVQQSGSLALSSLIHVTSSLTPNARGVFELLVRYQLEHRSSENEGGYLGMSFHDCYLKCREKFLVSSDVTLRSQLTEFKDHKLVRSRKGQDGVEYLFIPVDNAALGQFLEYEDEQ